jgi:two-component system sensor histidine kinase/response regulator
MLTSLKIEVDTAVDGQSAIARLEQAMAEGDPYDVVLLDWIMPGIDGIETARRIKANALLAKVPAMLMVTANGREEAYVEAEEVGLDGFLLKPVYASVMFNALLDILGIDNVSGPLTIKERYEKADLTDIRGAHILLADDNSINQEVASEFLRDVGMVVTIASDGQECLDALARSSYDLVLMDIQMPVMDGLEATRRIRQNRRFKDLPIIAMTAHAMTGDRDKSLAAGMNDHITKPIDPAVLYLALKKWIKGKEPAIPGKSVERPSAFASADGLSLPDLPGINREEALKILNNNADLFVKMLYDFQKNFSSLPTLLREMSGAGQWSEIQKKAHTVKGIAGYIGSFVLMQAAERLENALRNNSREEAVNHLALFINTLDDILSALSALPLRESNHLSQKLGTSTRVVGDEEVEETVQLLIDQLHRGEMAAEQQFGEVEKLLAGTGFDKQLQTIALLIEDIEYESAAEMVTTLLDTLRQNREN